MLWQKLVVVNFFQFIFILPLFLVMIMYTNEFKTKEKQKLTEIKKINCNMYMYIYRGRSRGRVEGAATPPLGSFQTCLATHVYPFYTKNNIITYDISSSPIDHYKKTVAIRDIFLILTA